MNVIEAIEGRRSIRRFQNKSVPADVLLKLADLARLYASGGNQQPIRTGIVSQQPRLDGVFASLNWAMYLPDFEILPSQRPQAYLILFAKNSCPFDCGAAAATVLLACREFGLSACPLGIARPAQLLQALELDETWKPQLAIALGYAAQESSTVPMTDTAAYSQDENGNMHVPKRSLEETLLFCM